MYSMIIITAILMCMLLATHMHHKNLTAWVLLVGFRNCLLSFVITSNIPYTIMLSNNAKLLLNNVTETTISFVTTINPAVFVVYIHTLSVVLAHTFIIIIFCWFGLSILSSFQYILHNVSMIITPTYGSNFIPH